MRKISAIASLLLGRPDAIYYYCVELWVNSGVVRHTNLPYDVQIGGHLFYADNKLKGIDPPRLSKTVDRASYKIMYDDPEYDFKTIFEAGATGAPVNIYIGFINTTDAELGGALPGNPLTNTEDVILAYRGVIDTYGYEIKYGDEVTVSIECSSPMADLALKNLLNATTSSMRAIDPTDKAYEAVHESSSQITLLWGKT